MKWTALKLPNQGWNKKTAKKRCFIKKFTLIENKDATSGSKKNYLSKIKIFDFLWGKKI